MVIHSGDNRAGSPLRCAQSVSITEVGPRDGLQNETRLMPSDEKTELIERLAGAGCTEIEITSFTHPKWIPALADAEEVARATGRLGITRFGLVPNRRGLERALAAGVEGVTLVMSASEGHNRANLNRSVQASLNDLSALHEEARAAGLVTRVSLSVVFGCPFDGAADLDKVVRLATRLAKAGADRIGLCDTVGMANPLQVEAFCRRLMEELPEVDFELHLHDTRGLALANAYAGWRVGIRRFDGAVGGLGGCPFAPGASGNVATEALDAMFAAMGVDTGLSAQALGPIGADLVRWRDCAPPQGLDASA
ncbi:hydroxymethylglutaryl-CoA lyase [Nitratireductor sp. StC3]|uniref:hydroxymethylglutaryl-CoA lyase n=1 Tax=Nitratireductor sp. StC3 TaxID=2126741 RepID=UPI000D0CD010|nr:hydroxymethylglutaryl-CoA lyase [Nitratireductor sp. StC3]PSM16404.1 hydroxymethylglutaryl-CoA lyase [Nitratireductor sp. StC3]